MKYKKSFMLHVLCFMLNKEDAQRIAKLARLGITTEEEKKFAKDLSAIFGYIEKLKEVDISKVEPMSHSVNVENVMREDKINEKLKIKNEKLMKLAPETKEGYLKVKSIF